MSPKTNPDYFGKSPFDHLKNVAAAAHKIMHPENCNSPLGPIEK